MCATWGASWRQPAHRSFWRERLAKRAGDRRLDEYLVAQANLRGFHGAYGADEPRPDLDPELELRDIVVGLLLPHESADGRVLKLVLRLLQSGQVESEGLLWLARKERAVWPLRWLMDLVPAVERNEAIDTFTRRLHAVSRGYRPPAYRYEPRRLIRRPFCRGPAWPTPPS